MGEHEKVKTGKTRVKAAGKNFTIFFFPFSSRCFPRRLSRDTTILSPKHQPLETMIPKKPNLGAQKLLFPRLPGLMRANLILQDLEHTKLMLRNPVVPKLCQRKL